MKWNELAELIKAMPASARETDVQVNLSKEPDKLTDIGPIGELREVRGEWVMELADEEM